MNNDGWYRSFGYGLLIIRLGLGIMYMIHGYPMVTGGPEKWSGLGGGMGEIGIHFAHAFWGFMAALAEFGGGVCLLLGVFFRPAVALMMFTMIIAVLHHISAGGGFNDFSHAAENGVTFLGLLLIGPGPYSLAALWYRRKLKS
jgi:putative oxidoreductase